MWISMCFGFEPKLSNVSQLLSFSLAYSSPPIHLLLTVGTGRSKCRRKTFFFYFGLMMTSALGFKAGEDPFLGCFITCVQWIPQIAVKPADLTTDSTGVEPLYPQT